MKSFPLFRAAPACAVRSAAHSGGFTLVEMLVVLTIIALVLGLVGPRVLNYLGEFARQRPPSCRSRASVRHWIFFFDDGRYPSSSEGLNAAGAAAGWHRDLEWPLHQGKPSASRSMGQPLSIPLTRGARSLRDRVLWFRWP